MATQIEARSLASLNYLAANPPQYPHNPAGERQEPLTLYISRVPGTRDVILATSKPHPKNVTSEDVANSFYYIHLEHPSESQPRQQDVGVSQHQHQHQHLRNPDTPRSSQDSARSANQIRRKPLPGSAKVPSPPAEPLREYPLPGSHPAAGGYGPSYDYPPQDVRPGLPSRPLSHSVPAPVRKPVGPRAIPAPALGLAPEDDPDHLRSSYSPSPSTSPARTPRAPTADTSHTRQLSRSPSPNRFHNTTAVPFTLSIIRRDPSTGNQWNIGRVSSHQLEDSGEEYEYFSFDSAGLSAHDRRRANAPQPPINVRIESSGYAKFRHMPLRQSVDAPRTSISSFANPPFANSEDAMTWHQQQQQMTAQAAEGGFYRQVVMAYTKSWTTNIREKFNARSRPSSVVIDDPFDHNALSTSPNMPRSNRHSRQLSTHSTGSASSGASDGGPIITQPGHGLRPKGYVFVSPWDGRCEFRTGNAGRSLKCRHVLPHPGGGLHNPLAPSGSSNSAPVSELRFNLPSAELFKPEGKREQLSGHFSKLLNIANGRGDDSDEDDVPSPFELKLGREKAGGGNRGKRAKLGKLIIYPEGLKMLDLIVAANIGVWWGAWEKAF
ncbi:hypothetical protein C8034_v004332 [Colletotrichum sidae]|uniref:Oxidoreductase-like protein n=1 Tax=Colletotrichum sidae TaxID=1347389 RepID=A0A4R8TS10_9PEZI|nr:hypothetical protein C8034_v004332 [Colletotrichum sidae]